MAGDKRVHQLVRTCKWCTHVVRCLDEGRVAHSAQHIGMHALTHPSTCHCAQDKGHTPALPTVNPVIAIATCCALYITRAKAAESLLLGCTVYGMSLYAALEVGRPTCERLACICHCMSSAEMYTGVYM